MKTKECRMCKQDLPIEKYQKVKMRGRIYTRHSCTPCRGIRDKQLWLKKRFEKGYQDVSLCVNGCGTYVKNKARIAKKCTHCINDKAEDIMKRKKAQIRKEKDAEINFLSFMKKRLLDEADEYKIKGDRVMRKHYIGKAIELQKKIDKVRNEN